MDNNVTQCFQALISCLKSSHSQVKATFADGPATKSPVSKGISTIYGKHRIIAHHTDPWQLIPPSPCTKVTAPANKEGNH